MFPIHPISSYLGPIITATSAILQAVNETLVQTHKEDNMKLVSVRLLTDDVATAIPFWRDILGLPMTYSDETMGYAYFETSTVGVELYSRDEHATALGATSPSSIPAGHQVVITFQVDDVDAAYAEAVARGAQSVA